MINNFYLQSIIKNKILTNRPLVSVVLGDSHSEMAVACLQLSTLTKAHKVNGQGKNIFEAVADGLHLQFKQGLFSWWFNKRLVKNIVLPDSILVVGNISLNDDIKISNLVLPVNFRCSSASAWFNKVKNCLAENCNIICPDDSDMAKYLEKKNYHYLVTYGLSKNAKVGAEDPSEYQNGFRWKLLTDGKTLPMALNGIKSERQIYNWLAAIALARCAGSSLTSIISQFQTLVE